MIRLFNVGSKINFVDDNNAFVGFTYEQSCCESFGWAIIMDRGERLLATDEKTSETGTSCSTHRSSRVRRTNS